MRIRLEMIEDVVMGYYGWIAVVNGKERFDYESGYYTTAQSSHGNLLSHDILEHNGMFEQENLEELCALGAVLHNRPMAFYNAYRNCFADEIGEQIVEFIKEGHEASTFKCTSRNSAVESEYDCALEGIESYVATELATYDDLKDCFLYDDLSPICFEEHLLDNLPWDDIHRLAKACMSKGYNEMVRKEKRYSSCMGWLFDNLKDTIDNNLARYKNMEEEVMVHGTTVHINFSYKLGVLSVTHRHSF